MLGAGAPACLAKWRKAAAKLLELEVDEGDDEDDDEDDERRPPAATTTLLLDPLWWRVDWLPLLLPLPLPLTLALDGGEIPATTSTQQSKGENHQRNHQTASLDIYANTITALATVTPIITLLLTHYLTNIDLVFLFSFFFLSLKCD